MMASELPAGLKSADVGRFALRAAQLGKAKPIIAYWCNFWIVNQIIEKGLHTTDEEVKLYTVNLMEKLEQFKNENPDNDAILDSVAASAYVEQFGLEVFGRAEAAMRANKVTRQTADTFQASATFLELCQIWNPLEPEIAAKVKFAKYHALRIAKAIKAGEDPNASNPVTKEEGEEEQIEEPGHGQQQQEPDAATAAGSSSQAALQPTFEDVPDGATDTSPPILPAPPTTSSELSSAPYNTAPASSRSINADTEQDSPLNLPSAPETFAPQPAATPNLPDTPTKIGTHHHPTHPSVFQSFPSPSGIPPPSPSSASHDVDSFYNPPSAVDTSRLPVQPTGPRRASSYSTHQPAPVTTPSATIPTPSTQAKSQEVDDQAIALAQKHARWAVSALAFDDVNTAIKELRNSLRHLNAE